MKKLLSILLVLVMLVPALSLAEGSSIYTHEEDPYYRCAYPEGWTVLTKETVDSLVDLGAAVNDNELLASYVDQVKTMDITMFMSPTMSDFVVIMAQPLGIDMPADQLIPLLQPTFLQQFQAIYPSMLAVNDGEVLHKGNNDFAKLAYTLPEPGDLDMCFYVIVLDKTMYASILVSSSESVTALFEETLPSFTTTK